MISFKKSLVTSTLEKVRKQKSKEALVSSYSPIAVEKNKLGNNFMKNGQFEKAIAAFEETIAMQPDYEDAYLNLAKAYKHKNNSKNAVSAYEKYLVFNPENTEAITALGEIYKEQGFYNQAIALFEKSIALKPDDDFAIRNLKESQHYIKANRSPQIAYIEKQNLMKNQFEVAQALVQKYFSQEYFDDMKNVKLDFAQTAFMGGYSNIAQYEHNKRTISITDKYLWANPSIIAAYLAHEYVHAKDNDSYTSIREEQDAFNVQADFWQKNNQGVCDPELDYVAELYSNGSNALEERVADIYRSRDVGIDETSPNHPPLEKGQISNKMLHGNVLPIKSYEVIA